MKTFLILSLVIVGCYATHITNTTTTTTTTTEASTTLEAVLKDSSTIPITVAKESTRQRRAMVNPAETMGMDSMGMSPMSKMPNMKMTRPAMRQRRALVNPVETMGMMTNMGMSPMSKMPNMMMTRSAMRQRRALANPDETMGMGSMGMAPMSKMPNIKMTRPAMRERSAAVEKMITMSMSKVTAKTEMRSQMRREAVILTPLDNNATTIATPTVPSPEAEKKLELAKPTLEDSSKVNVSTKADEQLEKMPLKEEDKAILPKKEEIDEMPLVKEDKSTKIIVTPEDKDSKKGTSEEIPEKKMDEHKHHKHGLLRAPEDCLEGNTDAGEKSPEMGIFHIKAKLDEGGMGKDAPPGKIEAFTAFIKDPMNTDDEAKVDPEMRGEGEETGSQALSQIAKPIMRRSVNYGAIRSAVRSSEYQQSAPVRSSEYSGTRSAVRSSEYQESAPVRSAEYSGTRSAVRSSEYEEAPVRSSGYSGSRSSAVRSLKYDGETPTRAQVKFAVRHAKPATRARVRVAPLRSSTYAEEAPVMSSAYAEEAPVRSSTHAEASPVRSSKHAKVAPVRSSSYAEEAPVRSSMHAEAALVRSSTYAEEAPLVPAASYEQVAPVSSASYSESAPIRSAPRVRLSHRAAAPVRSSYGSSLFDESSEGSYVAPAAEPEIVSDVYSPSSPANDEYSAGAPIRISSNRYRRSAYGTRIRTLKPVVKSSEYSETAAPAVKSSEYSGTAAPAIKSSEYTGTRTQTPKSSGYTGSAARKVATPLRSSKYNGRRAGKNLQGASDSTYSETPTIKVSEYSEPASVVVKSSGYSAKPAPVVVKSSGYSAKPAAVAVKSSGYSAEPAPVVVKSSEYSAPVIVKASGYSAKVAPVVVKASGYSAQSAPVVVKASGYSSEISSRINSKRYRRESEESPLKATRRTTMKPVSDILPKQTPSGKEEEKSAATSTQEVKP